MGRLSNLFTGSKSDSSELKEVMARVGSYVDTMEAFRRARGGIARAGIFSPKIDALIDLFREDVKRLDSKEVELCYGFINSYLNTLASSHPSKKEFLEQTIALYRNCIGVMNVRQAEEIFNPIQKYEKFIEMFKAAWLQLNRPSKKGVKDFFLKMENFINDLMQYGQYLEDKDQREQVYGELTRVLLDLRAMFFSDKKTEKQDLRAAYLIKTIAAEHENIIEQVLVAVSASPLKQKTEGGKDDVLSLNPLFHRAM